jgi:hypothetical protein
MSIRRGGEVNVNIEKLARPVEPGSAVAKGS